MATKEDTIRSLMCPGCTCPVGLHDSAGTCGNHHSCGCYRDRTVEAAYRLIRRGRKRGT